MSKFKGTPGPWEVEEDGFYEKSYIRQKAATRRMQGFIVECLICENVDNADDARLIAAAPELLEALEIAREFALLHAEPDDVALIDAAIAKATGGAA